LSVDVEALLVFQAISSIHQDGIVAVTVSQGVIQVTVNSKLVQLLGAISVGQLVTVPDVQDIFISAEVKVEVLIASSKTTLKVALLVEVGSL
jgi:hypothetical protein